MTQKVAELTFEEFSERALLLSGRIACRRLTRNTPIRGLEDVEFRAFSRWGEDGIIDWLADHVSITNHRFIEFGVGNLEELNCRFLLQNRNWKGLVFNNSATNIQRLRNSVLFWQHDLTAGRAFLTAENINDLICDAGFAGPIGILSIDINGNDYWVWKAIDCVDPAIVICEYNAVLGDTRPVLVPYDPTFERLKLHHSGRHCGASIGALQTLAREKRYTFVGSYSNGVDAFFVRTDLAEPVQALISDRGAFPSRHRDSRDAYGRLTFAAGADRLTLIQELPVLDPETGETISLGAIDRPYSDDWLSRMGKTPQRGID